MAIGDLYEVTLKGTLQGQNIANIFHYEQDVSFVSLEPTISHDVLNSFEAQVLPKIAAFTTFDVAWDQITCRNLFDVSDAAVKLISENGVIGSLAIPVDSLPSFTSLTFTLTGSNPAVAQGRKAMAGLGENYQLDGVVSTDAGFMGDLQDFCDQLATPLKSHPLMLSDLFIPVVVKRVRSGSPGAYTYRLPSSPAEKVVSQILVASWMLLVSSQTSRRFNVGS